MIQTAYLSGEKYLQIELTDKHLQGMDFPTAIEVEVMNPFSENRLFDQVTCFYYNSRVRLSFTLATEFNANFGMLKGLIEFYRMQRAFQYDAICKTISTDIDASQQTDIQIFFDEIKCMLENEINFKKALKEIIRFESQYREDQKKVYALLRATV